MAAYITVGATTTHGGLVAHHTRLTMVFPYRVKAIKSFVKNVKR